MTPAFFLDRDGVINVEVSYLGKAEDVELLPGVAEAVAAIVAHHAKLYNLLLAALPAYSGGRTPPQKIVLHPLHN